MSKLCEWCGESYGHKYHGGIIICPACRSRIDKYGRLERNKYIDCKKYYKIITTQKDGKTITGYAMIDKEDYEKCKFISWYLRNDGYIMGSINKKKVLMSKYLTGAFDKIVDHKNRKRYDNRKSNLRICAKEQENLFNRSKLDLNTSGYIGVTWDKHNNKWMAQIGFNGKVIKLGRFNNKHDALIARLKGEHKYFKEFAPQIDLIEKYKELIIKGE